MTKKMAFVRNLPPFINSDAFDIGIETYLCGNIYVSEMMNGKKHGRSTEYTE